MKKLSGYISEDGSMDYELLLTREQVKFNDWMYSKMKPYLKGAVLETGSGCGTFSEKIVEDFPGPIYLTEIDPKFIKYLKEKFKQKNVKVAKLDLNSKKDFEKIHQKFDSVYSSNVLEHVKDDVLALKLLKSKLNLHGRLVLLVPAHKFLFSSLDVAEGHYRRYTKGELERKCEMAGLKVVKSFWFNLFAIPGRFVNGNVFRSKKTHENSFRIFNALVPIMAFIEEKILFNILGVSRIVIAQNPDSQ